MNTTILAAVLASQPTGTPYAPGPPADVEVQTTDEAALVLAYDEDGETVTEIIVWLDDGRPRLDAVFPDGLYLTAIVDGDEVTIESDDAEEVAARVEMIDDYVREHDLEKPWAPCVIGAIGTVVGLAAANPWVLVTTYGMACSCLPLLIEEFEEIKCPGFG